MTIYNPLLTMYIHTYIHPYIHTHIYIYIATIFLSKLMNIFFILYLFRYFVHEEIEHNKL